MSDIVKRLRNPPFGTETSERNLMASAADTIEALRAGLKAVQALISDSYGVAGLHLNGDVASWDDLLAGGRFEDWLGDFSRAIKEER